MLGTLGLWAGAATGRGSAAGPVAAGPRAVLGARGGGGYAGLASCGCDRGLVGPAPRAPRGSRAFRTSLVLKARCHGTLLTLPPA